MKRFAFMLATSLLCVLMGAPRALACAACAQTEDTNMADGAKAGVIVMAVITYVVLSGFGGLTLFFMVRARRQRQDGAVGGPAPAKP